ncbi:MAG: HEAT repeat domain-containing protein [Phormidesmis sp.]
MTGRNNWVKATLVFGALSASLVVGATPAFSQVSALDRLLEQADATDATDAIDAAVEEITPVEQAGDTAGDVAVDAEPVITEAISIGPVSVEYTVEVAEREAAMLTLNEALDADGVTEILATAERAAVENEEMAVENEEMAVEKIPGAEALSRLESASIDGFSVDLAERDLTAAGTAFTVDASSVPALQVALSSDQALTRLYAADALWTLTGNSELVLPTLMQAAASEDADIQALAVAALGKMGGQASSAVPVLNELLNRGSRTRSIAQSALTVIRSGNPSSALLGIVARESRRRVLPAALRAIGGLWR